MMFLNNYDKENEVVEIQLSKEDSETLRYAVIYAQVMRLAHGDRKDKEHEEKLDYVDMELVRINHNINLLSK